MACLRREIICPWPFSRRFCLLLPQGRCPSGRPHPIPPCRESFIGLGLLLLFLPVSSASGQHRTTSGTGKLRTSLAEWLTLRKDKNHLCEGPAQSFANSSGASVDSESGGETSRTGGQNGRAKPDESGAPFAKDRGEGRATGREPGRRHTKPSATAKDGQAVRVCTRGVPRADPRLRS
jgi:hypothetical protein